MWSIKSRHNNPLRARTCQLTFGLTSTCLQTEVNDRQVSLGVMCDQHIESSRDCWLSILELPLKINSYPNSSWCWVVLFNNISLPLNHHGFFWSQSWNDCLTAAVIYLCYSTFSLSCNTRQFIPLIFNLLDLFLLSRYIFIFFLAFPF